MYTLGHMALGQLFQVFQFAANQGELFRVRPAFELMFALEGRAMIRMGFRIEELRWTPQCSRSTAVTCEMLSKAALEVVR